MEKKNIKKLQAATKSSKFSYVDDKIMAAFTGLQGDARSLIDYGRKSAQSYRLTYDETPSINYLTKEMARVVQRFTQTGGARPFGMSVMIAGLDKLGAPQLYQIDPSGMITKFKANAIGFDKQKKF